MAVSGMTRGKIQPPERGGDSHGSVKTAKALCRRCEDRFQCLQLRDGQPGTHRGVGRDDAEGTQPPSCGAWHRLVCVPATSGDGCGAGAVGVGGGYGGASAECGGGS
jgi:hypothetical protein